MILLRLPAGGVLVHSPTWLGEDTVAQVEAIGEPRVLFAPNHFHHLSVPRFRERWPGAMIVAGRDAIAGLKKRGHESAVPVDVATPLLPPGAHWLECQGTRAGETLLSLDGQAGRTWLACDAFFNVQRPVTGVVGFALRALKTTPGLCIGQTFNWLALRDRRVYREWVLAALDREKPTALWVSHGETVTRPDLPEVLSQLVRARV